MVSLYKSVSKRDKMPSGRSLPSAIASCSTRFLWSDGLYLFKLAVTRLGNDFSGRMTAAREENVYSIEIE